MEKGYLEWIDGPGKEKQMWGDIIRELGMAFSRNFISGSILMRSRDANLAGLEGPNGRVMV